MENLSIDKYNPIKVDIVNLVENCKKTVVSFPGDGSGYDILKENKSLLQKKRISVVAYLKDERQQALNIQRFVVALEKELLEIIEPVESEITARIKEIDEQEARVKRVESLPARHGMLKEIELVVDDEVLLGMDDKAFIKFLLEKKAEYLNEKERKMLEEQERINAEKLRLENEARIERARKEAELEAQKKAKRDAELAKIKAEEDKLRAIEEVKANAEREKQLIIDNNNLKEKLRLEAEQKIRDAAAAEKIEKEKAQEKLEAMKRYQKFLTDNGCTKANTDEFFIRDSGKIIVLYKKVAEFKK